MITVKDLPPHALQMARFALAEALANDGDGVPEAIVACINNWPGASTHLYYRNQKHSTELTLPLSTEASDGKTLVDTISDEVWRHDSSGDNCCATDPQEGSDGQ